MQRRVRDDLDKYVRQREEASGERHSRSEIAVECLRVGLAVNRVLDDRLADRSLTLRDRMGLARQAQLSFEPTDFDRSRAAMRIIADVEELSVDDVEDAILRARLSEE